MFLNINTDAAVVFTNKLEKLHRSALPVAIRAALNSAAFDVKKVTMPASVERTFIKRQPNFFKANSRVEMAKGFSVNSMKSIVGFTSENLKGAHNFAVSELEQQEYGGKIEHRTFIPLDPARGGSSVKPVRPVNRLSEIKGIINANDINANSRKAKFVRAAFKAGKGGFVIGSFERKKLYRIEAISKSSGKLNLKTKSLYSFEQGRGVRINKTGFMHIASMESAGHLEGYYIREAKKQIERLMTIPLGSSGGGRSTRGSVGRITKSLFR